MNNSIRSPVLSSGSVLMIAILISLVLSFVPYGYFVLYPFKLFTTWAHECGHALMATLVGGDVKSITLDPSTSGLTESLIPNSTFAKALVASAGYMGATLFGCLLLAATRLKNTQNLFLGFIGFLMVASLILWIRNFYGILAVTLIGATILCLSKVLTGVTSEFLMSLLAVQVGLNALFDIRVLFLLDSGQHSDAQAMASLTFLPSWFWAGLWMVMSIAALLLTFRSTRKSVL